MAKNPELRMTLAELVNQTFLLLGDPAKERYDEDYVKLQLNFAQMDFCLDTHMIVEEIEEFQLKANVFIYDLRQAALNAYEDDGTTRPYAFPMRIVYWITDTLQRVLYPRRMENFDIGGIDRSATGAPYYWGTELVGEHKIMVNPIPDEDGDASDAEGNINVKYCAYPNYMSADSDYPDITIASFHEALPFRAASRIMEEDGDIDGADDLEGQFQLRLARFRGHRKVGMTRYRGATPL